MPVVASDCQDAFRKASALKADDPLMSMPDVFDLTDAAPSTSAPASAPGKRESGSSGPAEAGGPKKPSTRPQKIKNLKVLWLTVTLKWGRGRGWFKILIVFCNAGSLHDIFHPSPWLSAR